MKKGCMFLLVLWMVLAGVYGYVAWQKTRVLFPAAMIAVLGGTFATVLVGSFAGIFTGARDRAALRRAVNGEALQDGRLEAASGPIRPLDAPLQAPFTGRACVAYEYDVKPPDNKESDFAGVALAPCAIDTPRGSVRVLGWAVLDQFPRETGPAVDRVRGAAYLEAAPLERVGVISLISVLSELLADDDGAIRKDFRIGATTVDLDGRAIEERIVPIGAAVTLLGRWSEAKRGFTSAGTTTITRLFPGDLPSVMRSVAGNTVTTFWTGLVLFLALHAILVPMYLFTPKAGLGPVDSVWDERDCDRQKTLLAAGANANESGSDGLTPLMNAAREGESACVENLIAAGARLETADKNGDTALAQAIVAGRDGNIEILRAAGAKDFRVTADTGRAVTEDSEPLAAVKDYIAAVHRGDFGTMTRLMEGASLSLTEAQKADLPFWQSVRPKSPVLVDGWMTEEAATLRVRGATAAGDHRIGYHLEDTPSGWRIKKEWFPDLR
jgi:hypothetical protein